MSSVSSGTSSVAARPAHKRTHPPDTDAATTDPFALPSPHSPAPASPSPAGPSRRPSSVTSSSSTPSHVPRNRAGAEGDRRGQGQVSAVSPRRRVARERTVYVKPGPVRRRAGRGDDEGSVSVAEYDEYGDPGPGMGTRSPALARPHRASRPSGSTSSRRPQEFATPPTTTLPLLVPTFQSALSLLWSLLQITLRLLGPLFTLALPYILALILLSALLRLARSYLVSLAWWLAKKAVPGLSSMSTLHSLSKLPGVGNLARSGLQKLDGVQAWALDLGQRLARGGPREGAGAAVVQVLDAPVKAGATALCALTGVSCQLSFWTRTFRLPVSAQPGYGPGTPHAHISGDSAAYILPYDDYDDDDDSITSSPSASGSARTDGAPSIQVELAQPFWRWSAERRRSDTRQMAGLARGLTGSVRGASDVLGSLELLGPGGLENIQYDKIWELSSTVRSGSNLESRDYFAQELWKLGDTARDLSDELQHFNSHANAQFAWLVENFNRLTAEFLLPPSERPPVAVLSRSLHSTVLLLSSTLETLSLEADSLASLALEGSVSGSLLRTQLDDTLHSLSATAAREPGFKRLSAEVAHFFVGGEPSRAAVVKRDIAVTRGVVEGLGGLVRRIEEWRGVCKGVRDQLGQWEGGMMGFHLSQDGGEEEEARREAETLRGWVEELAGAVGVRRGVGARSGREGRVGVGQGQARGGGARRVERIEGRQVPAIEL